MLKPTSEATYERARRLANISLWSIDLQCRRLRSSEPEDDVFVFRKLADWDFLIVALIRFRRAVLLASSVPIINEPMKAALIEFDSVVPALKTLRDVAEHVDDYAIDNGKNKSIKRELLEVSFLSDNGTTLEWLGYKINAEEALMASQKVFDVIKKTSSRFSK